MKKSYLIILLLASIWVLGVTLWKTAKKPTEEPQNIRVQGIILPHHELAAELINKSFQKLSQGTKPGTIVIYGTNHYFPISDTYTTTTEVQKEYSLNNVFVDNTRINTDHSIQVMLPYVHKYFPDAEVVSILVSAKYKSLDGLKDDAAIFAAKFGKENTLYIASVDFAHDVTLEEGLVNNQESIANISAFNYSEIMGYDNKHMDSPLAISTLLLTMQSLGISNWQTWFSSHGALLTDQLDMKGTSYVIGVFTD